TALHNALSNAGYYLSNYAELRSRTGANKEVIRRELESNDYLVLIIEHSALTQSGESDLEIARSAISIARQIGVPVILYHNLDSQSLLYLSKSLSFSLDQIGVVRCFRDFKDLSFEILTSLADHQKFFPSPGWMQQQDFEAINKSIENINSTIEELEAGKDRLEAFIDHCGEHNLRSAFENCEVLPKPPEFGERNWFASYENPIHRFSSETGNLPVLYIRVPNRFKPLLRQDEYVVVYDRYLGLKWWTLAKKNTSYVEALAYAQEISSREKENWRLPTVNEMITLMTRTRGTRKYMDEKVFPLGRWFWTSTREDDEIFYVDFNYLNSAVDKEQASPSGDVPAIRKKSVILVTSDTLVTPNDITENKRFAAEQMTIRAKKKSVGVDNLVSILFLAADPTDASRLRLGEELREIQEKLQLSKLRDRFALHQRMSVRPADISQALLDVQPQIVHFSGHGISMGALCFENQMGETHPIRPEALAALFEMFTNQVNCVLLNACYSEIQAEAIAKHIDYVIGMNRAIGDKAAIAFAIGFYQALGAGRTIEEAYKLGCVQIGLQDIPEHLTPVLIKKGQVHP
ncbi:MAG TPA: DUF1566 domain-containing protein, partial [candidate division Zixibacteria bacterium]|nr:DUF1566 domain-containing protein [candidate division Zixibacteria bacterium]